MRKLRHVYYHIDELGRDALVASALKKIGKSRNWNVYYGNKRNARFTNKLNYFDAIILPSLDTYKRYFPDNKNLPDNVFILPAEAVGQATKRIRRINAKYFGNDERRDYLWHESIKGFLLWGKDHLKGIVNNQPEYSEKSFVVGHPRLSKWCLSPKRNNENSKRKVRIGFVSRFGVINPFDGRGNMNVLYKGLRSRIVPEAPRWESSPENIDVEDLFYTELIDLKIYFMLMLRLDNNKFDFYIRPYPREDSTQWTNFFKKDKIKVKNKEFNAVIGTWYHPFTSWLPQVDIIISAPSTSFYDMLSQGYNPICIDKVFGKRKDHVLTESDDNNVILDFIYRPESFEELVQAIETQKDIPLKPGYEKILAGQTSPLMDNDSIVNIFDAIESLTPKNSEKYAIKKLALCYFHSFIVYFWNYLSRLKNHSKPEQGSTFFLTIDRAKWINQLSDKITSGSELY